MIILSEVAKKLEKILNGVDTEVTTANPTSFYYQVETEGFHIDHIEKVDKSGNFIPVFISSLGGQFNPVKGLKQGSYSFPIQFHFPVRFKKDLFALGDFLVDVFVGSIFNYGEVSGKAVSNISAPQFGEIQDLDLKQFEKWANEIYKKPIEIMEPWLSMTITLFLSNAAPGLIYGNDVRVDFSFTYDGKTYTLEGVDWDGGSIQSTSQAQSEQEEGSNEADGLPFGTAYGSSFKIYPNLLKQAKESPATPTPQNPAIYFYKELLKIWFSGNIQETECNITFTIANDNELKYTRKCFIQSIMAPIEKGQIFGLTLSFTKKAEEVEEETDA